MSKKEKREDKKCWYVIISWNRLTEIMHLKRVDQPEEELKVVARALLPAEIYEGCELHYELMQYSMK